MYDNSKSVCIELIVGKEMLPLSNINRCPDLITEAAVLLLQEISATSQCENWRISLKLIRIVF